VTLQPLAKKALVLSSGLLALAVLLGAFGAHGIKNMVEAKKLETYLTGVRYHFYHAFGIMLLGILHQVIPEIKVRFSLYSFLAGIFLFSFNCYLYVLTDIKIFALLVPLGGVLFVAGWVRLMISSLKLR
jgi:uncharacterized membrane protein YgdD (TMEM256/DUF423 family)